MVYAYYVTPHGHNDENDIVGSNGHISIEYENMSSIIYNTKENGCKQYSII